MKSNRNIAFYFSLLFPNILSSIYSNLTSHIALRCTHYAVRTTLYALLYTLYAVLSPHTVHAQYSDKYAPRLTRILFILDGSGSMKEPMDGTTRFELSKQIIGKYLDSLSRVDVKVETAVRVFGHQSPSTAKNCTDSQLEIPFGRHTAAEIKKKLDALTPQGWTPIAYSLENGAKDFPEDQTVKNSIVLITDGLETCGGDPCAVAAVFQQKKISIKPYIIGMGIPEESLHVFDCAGKFFEVTNTQTFEEAMTAVVTQSLNPTTSQINLINESGKPVETNVEVTLYDSYSGKMLYNFVHALSDAAFPDTLHLNPSGKYDITVQSIPPVTKKGIELVAGTHNVIAIDLPRGDLKLTETGYFKRETPLQCIIHQKGKSDILIVQDFNTTRKYLSGTYDLEILTLPRINMNDVKISQKEVREVAVPVPGTMMYLTTTGGIAGVFVEQGGEFERIYEFKKLDSKGTLLLQPGKYSMVYRLNNRKNSAYTRTINFEINSGQTTTVRL